jgi:1-acyl-sn-glycerol-3-phosphate acyltransferase
MSFVYIFFSLFTWVEMVFCLIVFMPVQVLLFLLTALFDKKRRIMHYNSGIFSTIALAISPVLKVKVTGKEHIDRSKAHVVVMNHQSLLDVLLSFRLFYPAKMIGKKVLALVPIIGWNLFLSGHIFVDRSSRKSQFATMHKMEELLLSGDSLLIYPEGTRTRDGNIAQFKKGAFRSAVKTGTAIMPVLIDGAFQALPKGGFIAKKRHHLFLHVLPSIPVDKGDSASALAAKCHEIMSKELELQRKRPL